MIPREVLEPLAKADSREAWDRAVCALECWHQDAVRTAVRNRFAEAFRLIRARYSRAPHVLLGVAGSHVFIEAWPEYRDDARDGDVLGLIERALEPSRGEHVKAETREVRT